MKKIKWHIINGNEKLEKMKRAVLLVVCISLCMSITGCVRGNRIQNMARESQEEEKLSDGMMQLIVEALEKQDAEALKNLFSPYALEKAENLDEKIEELMEFYPGSDGGVEGDCISHKRSHYGKITLILRGTYKAISNSQEYQIRFIVIPRSDEETEKTGLYLIEVMTEEAEPEGFKWRNEEDEPGVYVLEPQEL